MSHNATQILFGDGVPTQKDVAIAALVSRFMYWTATAQIGIELYNGDFLGIVKPLFMMFFAATYLAIE